LLLFSDLLIWLNLYDDQIACQCWCRQSANTQHTKLKSGASNLHGAGASNLQDNKYADGIEKRSAHIDNCLDQIHDTIENQRLNQQKQPVKTDRRREESLR